MSIQVVFYDYVDASGENCIKAWMDSIGVKPRSKINSLLRTLENVPRAQWHQYSKYIENLKGAVDLWEIKAYVDKVRWRPIGCLGPGENTFTLLAGAIERGGKFEPATALDTAQQRKNEVRKDTLRYRTHHAYK